MTSTPDWTNHIGEWVLSIDGEIFGPTWDDETQMLGDTKYFRMANDAIAYAKDSGHRNFYVGQVAEPSIPGLNGFFVLEELKDQLFEEIDMHAFECLNLTPEEQHDLAVELTATAYLYLKKHGYWPPPRFAVANVQQVHLPRQEVTP